MRKFLLGLCFIAVVGFVAFQFSENRSDASGGNPTVGNTGGSGKVNIGFSKNNVGSPGDGTPDAVTDGPSADRNQDRIIDGTPDRIEDSQPDCIGNHPRETSRNCIGTGSSLNDSFGTSGGVPDNENSTAVPDGTPDAGGVVGINRPGDRSNNGTNRGDETPDNPNSDTFLRANGSATPTIGDNVPDNKLQDNTKDRVGRDMPGIDRVGNKDCVEAGECDGTRDRDPVNMDRVGARDCVDAGECDGTRDRSSRDENRINSLGVPDGTQDREARRDQGKYWTGSPARDANPTGSKDRRKDHSPDRSGFATSFSGGGATSSGSSGSSGCSFAPADWNGSAKTGLFFLIVLAPLAIIGLRRFVSSK